MTEIMLTYSLALSHVISLISNSWKWKTRSTQN